MSVAPTGDRLLRATAAIPPERYARVRREMVLRHCKWDPQVGDAPTLADFALVMERSEWRALAQMAEALARETVAAEEEILAHPEWWRELGVPRRLRAALREVSPGAAIAGRVMRFDFHETAAGWRVSEVNSDVPGGYGEASGLSALMAAEVGGAPAGDAGAAVARLLVERARGDAVALLCAPGYMEDRQVVAYLAKRVQEAGGEALCVGLRDLSWEKGTARRRDGRRIGALLRFFQAEWLARLPRRWGWRELLIGGATAVVNPATAVVSENKGFPLVWDRLREPMAMWRKLLPQTRALHEVDWSSGDWVLKERYSNNGDSVVIRGVSEERVWRRVRRDIRWRPGGKRAWVAQERFEPRRVETPLGPVIPCLGVYVVGGAAVGIYGRVTRGAVVDFAACDVAVLLEDGDDP